jgi:large subunit ribosomal protein L24
MRRKSNLIPKLHVKKGDTVKVIAGDDRGKTGRIIEIFVDKRRAKVEGVNIVIKHSKPSAAKPEGGRIEMEASIDLSNLMLVDPKSGKPTRVGRKENSEGKLVRVSVKTKEEIKK